jgi:hypothetical protein
MSSMLAGNSNILLLHVVYENNMLAGCFAESYSTRTDEYVVLYTRM